MINTRIESAQSVWVVSTPEIELCLTQTGGMMAPVTFRRVGAGDGASIQPYYISPWQEENLQIDEPVLVPLRGDFFCAPFGAGGEHGGRMVVSHGASATGVWEEPEVEQIDERVTLRTRITSEHPAGTVTKTIRLRTGEHAIYSTHSINGFALPMPVGHHATLACSDDAPLLISRSAYRFGRVDTANTPVFAGGEYRALLAGAEFESLDRVPTRFSDDPVADCTVFPAREGFVDILSTFDESDQDTTVPAWTTAVRPASGYLWFSLKDPSLLPSSVFWMENRGRHGEPWNGRNQCIGLEDVCAYYASGLAASAEHNELNDAGIATSLAAPADVHYVQGIVPVPASFGHVRNVTFTDGRIEFSDGAGTTVNAAVDWAFALRGPQETT